MVISTEEVGIKRGEYADNNKIISDSTLCHIVPTQLNKMSALYKVMCVCGCCISSKIMNWYLLSWQDNYLKKLKYQIQNVQNRRFGEMANRLFETYKNYVMSYGCNIYQTAYEMFMAKICAYPPSQYELLHWKFVLSCCVHFPRIYLQSQLKDRHSFNTSPKICFHGKYSIWDI